MPSPFDDPVLSTPIQRTPIEPTVPNADPWLRINPRPPAGRLYESLAPSGIDAGTAPGPLEFMQRALALIATPPDPPSREAPRSTTPPADELAGPPTALSTDGNGNPRWDKHQFPEEGDGTPRRIEKLKIMTPAEWAKVYYPAVVKKGSVLRSVKQQMRKEYNDYVDRQVEVYKVGLLERQVGAQEEATRKKPEGRTTKRSEDFKELIESMAGAEQIGRIQRGEASPQEALDQLYGRGRGNGGDGGIPSAYDFTGGPIGSILIGRGKETPGEWVKTWLTGMQQAMFRGANTRQLGLLMLQAPTPVDVFDAREKGLITAQELEILLGFITNPQSVMQARENAAQRSGVR